MPKTKKVTPATEPDADIRVRCVVAATNADGAPDFYACIVPNGQHYIEARSMAEAAGFDGPMVVFDEDDGPSWLFAKLFAAPLKKHVADYIRLSELLDDNEDWLAQFRDYYEFRDHRVVTLGHFLDEMKSLCLTMGCDYDYFKAKISDAGDVAFVRIDE